MKSKKAKKVGFGDAPPPDWTKVWKGMPAFRHEDLEPWQTLKVHFAKEEDRQAFAELIGQKVSCLTKSVWHPKAEIGRLADKRWITPEKVLPKYPIYVPSKGRWESRLTVKTLEEIGVPFRVVVEPQEFKKYARVISEKKLLTLPFSDLGKGSIPARNWIWEHAKKEGSDRHWVIDDNVDGFYRYNGNLKVPVETGATFRAIEDFVDRYTNVALAGMNYFMFASRKSGGIPPFTLNTRIYSCILVDTGLEHRWRGRYNEDTDLSIRVLKDGLCTVLFNAFLAMKQTTMSMKGGNTDELYQGDGRLKMARSLERQHPDIVTVTRKWHRWQHHVDYRKFKRNKLILKSGIVVPEGVDDFGMELELLGNRKPLLVGEASKKGPPFRGRSGRLLASLLDLSLEGFLNKVEAVNLLETWPGKDGKGDAFPADEAKEAAAKLDVRERDVIVCGKRVARAFGITEPRFLTKVETRRARFWIVPHPSGINAWWNDEANRERAASFLKEALKIKDTSCKR